ncbi:MAG: peptide ABC transporter permease [Planctomycetota bacterium]|nr:MAG: peptide ABC transporter permease [Planctomycetota bacterium]
MIPTFIGITFLCLLLTTFIKGGPVEQRLAKMKGAEMSEGGGGTDAGSSSAISEDLRKQIEKQFHFDKPLLVRYYIWLVEENIGLSSKSFQYNSKTVYEVISSRFKISLIFGITGFILTYLICIPLGILKALKDGSKMDLGTSLIVFAGYSLPAFSFGMLLKLMFCGSSDFFFDILPATGFVSDSHDQMGFIDRQIDIIKHMALPLCCYVIGNFAVLTILMKNSLLEQISQDYIRTVIARGTGFNVAIWKHSLRNSLIPITTGFGSILTVMFAGSVIIERIFEIPGMGRLSLEAIVTRDYAVFLGILSITSILGMFGQLLSDFCYMLIDPRINFDK